MVQLVGRAVPTAGGQGSPHSYLIFKPSGVDARAGGVGYVLAMGVWTCWVGWCVRARHQTKFEPLIAFLPVCAV
jgi:hypothetical protein